MAKKVTKKATKKTAKKIAAKAASKKSTANKKTTAKKPATRRPDPNLPPSAATVNAMTDDILRLIQQLESYTANLRALDRQRHNAVGLKRLGFIEAAFRISSKFPQYFPHWLNTPKFKNDIDLFTAVRSLVEVCRSLEEKAWNINIESADMIYTDALEYYSQVQDASNRRVDSAESLYKELNGFFKHGSTESENGINAAEPTTKKLKRDVNALVRGDKDGEVVIRNITPKTKGGKREIIDETFKNSANFKDTIDGEINE